MAYQVNDAWYRGHQSVLNSALPALNRDDFGHPVEDAGQVAPNQGAYEQVQDQVLALFGAGPGQDFHTQADVTDRQAVGDGVG